MRPSRKTVDAAVAAFADVALGGATCDNALPAADFDAFPVELLERTEEELFAALLPVIFVAILHPPKKHRIWHQVLQCDTSMQALTPPLAATFFAPQVR